MNSSELEFWINVSALAFAALGTLFFTVLNRLSRPGGKHHRRPRLPLAPE